MLGGKSRPAPIALSYYCKKRLPQPRDAEGGIDVHERGARRAIITAGYAGSTSVNALFRVLRELVQQIHSPLNEQYGSELEFAFDGAG